MKQNSKEKSVKAMCKKQQDDNIFPIEVEFCGFIANPNFTSLTKLKLSTKKKEEIYYDWIKAASTWMALSHTVT